MAELDLGLVVGPAGPGVPSGGTTGQVLKKKSAADYDTEWEAAGTADALPLAGGTMSGSINMDGNRVTGLGTPSASGDAVPKGYADNTVVVSDTQPTAQENKLWVDTDAGSGANYQIPTVAEMQAADALRAKADEIGIVITGARPSMVVSAGQYVIVRGSTITGITDGLYKAINALSPSTDVTAADLMAVSGGGLNAIQKRTTNLINFTSQKINDSGGSITIVNGLAILSGYFRVSSDLSYNEEVAETPVYLNSINFFGAASGNVYMMQMSGNKLLALESIPSNIYINFSFITTLS